MHFDDGQHLKGALKSNRQHSPQPIVLQPSVEVTSEHGGTASYYSGGRASSAAPYASNENLSSYRNAPVLN